MKPDISRTRSSLPRRLQLLQTNWKQKPWISEQSLTCSSDFVLKVFTLRWTADEPSDRYLKELQWSSPRGFVVAVQVVRQNISLKMKVKRGMQMRQKPQIKQDLENCMPWKEVQLAWMKRLRIRKLMGFSILNCGFCGFHADGCWWSLRLCFPTLSSSSGTECGHWHCSLLDGTYYCDATAKPGQDGTRHHSVRQWCCWLGCCAFLSSLQHGPDLVFFLNAAHWRSRVEGRSSWLRRGSSDPGLHQFSWDGDMRKIWLCHSF